MTTLLEAAQQALEALEQSETFVGHEGFGITRRKAESNHQAAIIALRAALIREEEASAWLAERKEHWRKEREKAQTTKDQDPELSAALGWPGGISDPVLDRTRLLQMVAALRLASKQALEALEYAQQDRECPSTTRQAIAALRAALALEQAEPLQEPGTWVASPDGRAIYDDTSADDGLLRVSGDFANDEQRLRYAQRIVDALNAALSKAEPAQKPVAWRYKPMIGSPWSLSDDGYYISCKRDKGYAVEPLYTTQPRREMVPLTEEEIVEAVREADLDWQAGWTLDEHAPNRFDALARAVEKASWEKNHG